jgi:hypothetical protein
MSVWKFKTLTLAGVAALASIGVMQGAVQGRFHLPTEARWGQVVLQPGDYTIELPTLSLDESHMIVQGEGKRVFETPHLAQSGRYSDSSYLKLTMVDGEYYVTEFSSGITGQTFGFQVPKAARRQLTSNAVSTGLALAVK